MFFRHIQGKNNLLSYETINIKIDRFSAMIRH
jgi:hypothetical protein